MEDDFNTPIAFATLHDLRGEVNRSKSPEMAAMLKALGGTIGLFQAEPEGFMQGAATGGKGKVGEEALDINALINQRNAAKKSKDFARADAVRKQLDEAGIVLEDRPGGVTEWRRK